MKSTDVFEILIKEHAAMLLTYIRATVGSPKVVDDIFQETMITAWHKLAEDDKSKPFGAWLRGIAKNHARNHYRKYQRDMLVCNDEILDYLDTRIEEIDMQSGRPYACDMWHEKVAALHVCIQSLPDKYQNVIQLRYLEDLKTSDVGRLIDIPRETLKKRLQRAKTKLYECLLKNSGLFQTKDVT